MVLFRSPVQAIPRLTSPLVVVEEELQQPEEPQSVHNDAEETHNNPLLLETPGKGEHLWSQRIQESLNAVAASPSSKRNAPAPFASSSKLRRSPPASHVQLQQQAIMLDQHDKQASQNMILDAEEIQDPFVKRSKVERTPPGAAGFPDTRESQTQSRALFDDRASVEPAKAATNQHFSPPSLGASLMPIPASLHRPRASLPDASILRSAPMVPSTSRLSTQSTPTQRSTSALKLPGTPEVAKIGRLNARIALLESQKDAAEAGREAMEIRNKALEEKCQFLEADQAEKQGRLAEYEALAEEWEGTLNDYGAVQLEVEELRRRHLEDEAGLLRAHEDQAERKLKEKKYRNELRWRQAESRWRDLTIVTKNKREAEVELIARNLKVIELTRAYNMERASSEYFKGCLKDVKEELQDVQESYTSLKQRSSGLSAKCTAMEQSAAQSSRNLARLEQDNATLQKENERLEEEVAQLNAAENASQATSGQLVDLQKQVRQREKETAKASQERDNALERLKELNNELKGLKAELNQKDKKIKSLEQKIEYDDEERRQIDAAREVEEQMKRDADLAYQQEQEEMHNRAKKAFGTQDRDEGSQSQGSGSQQTAKGKGTKNTKMASPQAIETKAAKASKPKAKGKAAAEPSRLEEDDEQDESFGLPPPLSTSTNFLVPRPENAKQQQKPKAACNKSKAPKVLARQRNIESSTSDEEEVARPAPKKASKKGTAHPSKARKSMSRLSTAPLSDDGASKRKRVEDIENGSDPEPEEAVRPPKKTKTKKAQNSESRKPAASQDQGRAAKPTVEKAKQTKAKKADSSTSSAPAGNRKTALYGGNKSAFVWDQTAKGKSILQDLPDHLSPIKPSY